MNIQGAFRLTAAILLLQTVLAHAGYHMPDRLTQIQETNRSIRLILPHFPGHTVKRLKS